MEPNLTHSQTAAVAAPPRISWPSEPERFLSRPQAGPAGVSGWLLFFCISLTVLAPLLVLFKAFSGGFELDNMVELALAAYGVLVGMSVWSVHPRAFVLLWIYFGITALLLALGIIGTVMSPERRKIRRKRCRWSVVLLPSSFGFCTFESQITYKQRWPQSVSEHPQHSALSQHVPSEIASLRGVKN